MSLSFFPSRRMRAAVLWAAFGVWMTALWILSSRPAAIGDGPSWLPVPLDKFLHFLYFFSGAVCLLTVLFHCLPWRPWKLALAAFLIMAAIGATDEWHQTFTPHRQGGDPFDWTADCLGAAAAVLTVVLIHGKFRREAYS
jgi:VanZ family protein